MLVSLNFSNFSVTFTADEFNEKYAHLDTVCVTVIDFDTDSIIDHFVNDVTITKDGSSVSFSSVNTTWECGVFDLVCAFCDNVSTLMDVFKDYDGEIISFNNRITLCTERGKVVNPGSIIYIITGYNDGEHCIPTIQPQESIEANTVVKRDCDNEDVYYDYSYDVSSDAFNEEPSSDDSVYQSNQGKRWVKKSITVKP